MRLLFFSTTLPNFTNLKGTYNGGGWIGALVKALATQPTITVAVAYISKSHASHSTEEIEGVKFYPITRAQDVASRILRFTNPKSADEELLDACMPIISDFHPDVIQVFGLAESAFGLLCLRTSIPVCIHIQGLLRPCWNAWVPPFYTKCDYIMNGGLWPHRILYGVLAFCFVKYAVKRELIVLKSCKYLLGRTHWDHAYSQLYAPQAKYFHCDEMLREVFWAPSTRKKPEIPIFISSLSSPLYKGHDLVLKTAKTLKETGLNSFEWQIFGVTSLKTAERKTGIKASQVNVHCKGIVSAEEIKNALTSCTAYIHPSYIENSPNSICEAQLLEVPVIATHVGGVASLVGKNESGVLVPANDPLALAFTCRSLLLNPDLASSLALFAKKNALHRHNPERIITEILRVYTTILSSSCI